MEPKRMEEESIQQKFEAGKWWFIDYWANLEKLDAKPEGGKCEATRCVQQTSQSRKIWQH